MPKTKSSYCLSSFSQNLSLKLEFRCISLSAMKLSFTLPSKPNSNKPIQSDHEEEEEETLAPLQKRRFTIPRLENTWKPHLRFEADRTTEENPNSSLSYGLNVRTKKEEKKGSEEGSKGKTIEETMLDKFREDIEKLPQPGGLEDFEEVPVEGYGTAVLEAYGWKEGMGIGRNAKGDVKVKLYERKVGREGLGFVPQKDEGIASKGDVMEIEEVREVNVGKIVRVVGGRHVGFKGKVLSKFEDLGVLVLKLVKSEEEEEEEVRVKLEDVAELGSVEEERCLKEMQGLGIRDGRREVENGERVNEEMRKSTVSWLRSHIRVRVISKDFKGGKLYLKKGVVVDVVGPALCDICMDESNELVQGVDQSVLETALPRSGGPVLVLYGEHKGVFGDLVEKNVEKETGVVRDADSHTLLNVRLEQVAEYIGDPSLIGY